MKIGRISIFGTMIVIAIIGVGLAAFAQPFVWVSSAALTISLASLGPWQATHAILSARTSSIIRPSRAGG